MSLFTSNSEFDAEKHVQITNEMPPYDMYTGVNSVLQNDMWKWFLGYTKVTTDIDYNENPALTYTKKTNGNLSESYGPKPKNLYTIDGKPIHTIPKFRSLEVNGALSVEQDLFLHEIYRYLDTLYPDHYDWRHLLTNNEINDAFTNAAAVVDYKPNNDFFDLVARNLEGIETEDEIEVESLKIKLRNLRNNAYRRKLYGSKIGYRMFCGDIFQLCSIYPLGTYMTIKPVEKSVIKSSIIDGEEPSMDQINSFRKIDTLNQNYSKKFKLIDWENDLSIHEDIKNKKHHFTSMTIPGYYETLFEVPNNIKEDATIDDLRIGMHIFRDDFEFLEKAVTRTAATSEYPRYVSTTSTNDVTRADDPDILSKFYGYLSHEFMTIDCDLQHHAYFVWKLGTVSLENVEEVNIYVSDIKGKEKKEYKLVWTEDQVKEIRDGDIVRLIFRETDPDLPSMLFEFDVIPIDIVERESSLQVNSIRLDSELSPKFQEVYRLELNDDVLCGRIPGGSLPISLRQLVSSYSDSDVLFGDDLLPSQGRWLYKIMYNIDPGLYNKLFVTPAKVLFNPYIDGTLLLEPDTTLKSYETDLNLEFYTNDDGLRRVIFHDEGHRLWEDEDFPLRKDDYIVRKPEWNLGEEYDVYGVVDWTRGRIKVESDGSLPLSTFSQLDDNSEYAIVLENSEGKRCLIYGKIKKYETFEVNTLKFWYSFEVDIHSIPEDLKDDKLFNMAYPEYKTSTERLNYLIRLEASGTELSFELKNEKEGLEISIAKMESQRENREYMVVDKIDSDNVEYRDYGFGIDDKLVYVLEFMPPTQSWTVRNDFASYTIKNLNYGLLSVMPYIHQSQFVYADDWVYGRRDYTKKRYINVFPEAEEFGLTPKETCIQYFDFEPLRAHRRNPNELPYGTFYYANDYMFWSKEDRTNTYAKKPESTEVIIRGLIDISSEELRDVITFDDDIGKDLMKSFNPGDMVYGPQIISDDVYITEIGLDYIRVNNKFVESGHFEYIVNATNQCIPSEIDKFNLYKTEQYTNGHYDKVNIFNTSVYPSEGWPNTAQNGYISGLLDISQFSVYNYANGFHTLMNVIYSDYYNDGKNHLFPAVVKFENDIFVELNIRGLLKTKNRRGVTPTLMNVEYLDYLEENLYETSRATDSVSVGASLVLNGDTSGKFSLLQEAKYTDPSIRSKFQTFHWKETSIPKYAQIGAGGEGYESLFVSASARQWPHVYGAAVWDGYQEDFYERYNEAVKAHENDDGPEFSMSKRHVWTSLVNTLKNFTEVSYKKDVEKPLFEIPLGEYDVQLNFQVPNNMNIYTTIQANFYKQAFKNILVKDEIFHIKENTFIEDEFIVGNKEDLYLTENKKYKLLEHNQLGIYNRLETTSTQDGIRVVYPEIKNEYKIGDFFVITQGKQLNLAGVEGDRNFSNIDIISIESPSLLVLDYDKNGNKYWKYCTFRLSGIWGNSESPSASTLPIRSVGYDTTVPTRNTIQGDETDQLAYIEKDKKVYWTIEEANKMNLSGRDLMDTLALKVAKSTSEKDIDSTSVVDSIRYQFTKEDLFSKKYKIIKEEDRFKSIDDEDSHIYMMYYSGGSDSDLMDYTPEELKGGNLEVGDIICVYIYKLSDKEYNEITEPFKKKEGESPKCNVVAVSTDTLSNSYGYLTPLTREDFLSNVNVYETEEIEYPRWGISAFVIKRDNVWSTKINLTRDLFIEDYDWRELVSKESNVSPLKGLEENFNILKLPRGAINPGSEKIEFVLDPKFKSRDISGNIVDISSYPIKYDSEFDNFYITNSDGTNQIIKFNENKFFKNTLKIRGTYQKINMLDENNNLDMRAVLMPINGESWGSSLINADDFVIGYNEVKLRSNWSRTLEPVTFTSTEKIEGRLIGFGTNASWAIAGRNDGENPGLGNSEFMLKMQSLLPQQEGLFEYSEEFTDFNKSNVLRPRARNVKILSTPSSIRPSSNFESLVRTPVTTYFRNLAVGEFKTDVSASNVLDFSGSTETDNLVGLLKEGDAGVRANILTKLNLLLVESDTLDVEGGQFSSDSLIKDVVYSDAHVYMSDMTGNVYQVYGKEENVCIRKLNFARDMDKTVLAEGYDLVSATTTDDDKEVLVLTNTSYNSSFNEIVNPLSLMFFVTNEFTLSKYSVSEIEKTQTVNEYGLLEMPTDILFPQDVSLGENKLNVLTALNAGQMVFNDNETSSTSYIIEYIDDKRQLNVSWTPNINNAHEIEDVIFHYEIYAESKEEYILDYVIGNTPENGLIIDLNGSDETYSSLIINGPEVPEFIDESITEYATITLKNDGSDILYYIAQMIGLRLKAIRKYNNETLEWDEIASSTDTNVRPTLIDHLDNKLDEEEIVLQRADNQNKVYTFFKQSINEEEDKFIFLKKTNLDENNPEEKVYITMTQDDMMVIIDPDLIPTGSNEEKILNNQIKDHVDNGRIITLKSVGDNQEIVEFLKEEDLMVMRKIVTTVNEEDGTEETIITTYNIEIDDDDENGLYNLYTLEEIELENTESEDSTEDPVDNRVRVDHGTLTIRGSDDVDVVIENNSGNKTSYMGYNDYKPNMIVDIIIPYDSSVADIEIYSLFTEESIHFFGHYDHKDLGFEVLVEDKFFDIDLKSVHDIPMSYVAGTWYAQSFDTSLKDKGLIRSCITSSLMTLPGRKGLNPSDPDTWPITELNMEYTTGQKLPTDNGKLGSLIKFDSNKDYGVYIDGNKIAVYSSKYQAVVNEMGNTSYDTTSQTASKYWTKSVIPFSSEETYKRLSSYNASSVYNKLKEEIILLILSYISITDDIYNGDQPSAEDKSYLYNMIQSAKPLITWLYGNNKLPKFDSNVEVTVENAVSKDSRWKFVEGKSSYSIDKFNIINDIPVLNSKTNKVWSGMPDTAYISFAADIFKYVLGNTTNTLLNNIIEDAVFTNNTILFKTITNNFFGIDYENVRKKETLDDSMNWWECGIPENLKTSAYEELSSIDMYRQFNTSISYKENEDGEIKKFNSLSSTNDLNIFEPLLIEKKNDILFIGGYKLSANEVLVKRFGTERSKDYSDKASKEKVLGSIYKNGNDYVLHDTLKTPIILYSVDDGKNFEEVKIPSVVSNYSGLIVNSMMEMNNYLYVTFEDTTVSPNPDSGVSNTLSNKMIKISLLDSSDGTVKKLFVEETTSENSKDYDYVEVDLKTVAGSYGNKKYIPITGSRLNSTKIEKSKMLRNWSANLGGVEIEKIDRENKKIYLNNSMFVGPSLPNQEVRVLVSFDSSNHIKNPMIYLEQSKMSDYLNPNGGFMVPFTREVQSATEADLAHIYNEWNYYINKQTYSLELRSEPGNSEEDAASYPSTFRDNAYFFEVNPLHSTNPIKVNENSIPNNDRRTFYNWQNDNPIYYTNSEGTELTLCSEDGLMIVTKSGVRLPVTQMLDQYNIGIFAKCPKPAKSQLQFLKSDIMTKEDMIITEAMKNVGWKKVLNFAMNNEQSLMNVDFGEEVFEYYKDYIYFTQGDETKFIESEDDLSEIDMEFYNATSTSVGPVDITDYHSSENSRYIKWRHGDHLVWVDTRMGITPLKKNFNIVFDLSIPYKYSGQTHEKYTEINVTDGRKIKSIHDDIPITGMYFTPAGYGGTRTQTSWSNYPWENDIIAFKENDNYEHNTDKILEATNDFDGKVLLCNIDGTAVIKSSDRYVEPNELTTVRVEDLDESHSHVYEIMGKDVIKQTIVQDFIVGNETQLLLPKELPTGPLHIHLKDPLYEYNNDIVGYMRITDGYDDIDLDYINEVIFENTFNDGENVVINELQWNNGIIFATGGLSYIQREVNVTVKYINGSSISMKLIADGSENIPDDIENVEWEDLKYNLDNTEIKYSLYVNDIPHKTDKLLPYIVTAGIVHTLDNVEVDIYEGTEVININQKMSYLETSISGNASFNNDTYVKGIVGPVFVKQPKYNSFRELLDNEGTSIAWTQSEGSRERMTSNYNYDYGKVSGETIIGGRPYLVFDKFLNNDYLNNGDAHIIEMEFLTESSIVLNKVQMNDEKYFVEIPLSMITKYTPDRVYFHPNGYPMSPVSYKGNAYYSENASFYNNSYYTNSNGNSIILCDENGLLRKYVMRNNNLEIVSIPKGNSYNNSELAIIKTPKYTSCKEWYRSDFYVEGESQNPFWHYVNLGAVYNSTYKKFETKIEYLEKIKESGHLKYANILDGKYINLYNTSYLVLNNDTFSLNNTALDYKNGEIRLLFLEGDESYKSNNSFIKYGIYAAKELEDIPILKMTKDNIRKEDLEKINVRDIISNYDCNTLENTINVLDKEKAITQITEFGLFDQDHNMIAYSIFPPIEYRSDTQHVSITSIITNGKHTPLEEIKVNNF